MPFSSKEKIKEYNKEYKKNNKESICLSQKSRRRKNLKSPEWVIKRDELSKEDFRKWQIEKKRKRARDRYARNKQIIEEYKRFHPCYCGENNINCLEFHHRNKNTKKFEISNKGKQYSIDSLKKEIAKCDILCKNCHTKLHNKDILDNNLEEKITEIDIELKTKLDKKHRQLLHGRKRRYQGIILVRDYKIEHNCKNCNEDDPNCLAFHHKDPSTKKDKIPNLYKYGIKKVQKEIDKCELLCHNCHSKLHNNNFLLESVLLYSYNILVDK